MRVQGSQIEDPSYTSARSQSISRTNAATIQNAVKSFLDLSFPLLEEVNTIAPESQLLTTILHLAVFLQEISCFSFFYYPDLYPKDKLYRAMKTVFCIGDLGISYLPYSGVSYITIFQILFSFLCISLIIFIVFSYHRNKTISKVSIYTSRLIFSFFVPMAIICSGYSVGNAFYRLTQYFNGTNMLIFFFSVISLFILWLLFYVGEVISSYSPFLNSNAYGFWDGTCDFTTIICGSIIAFLQYFSFVFPPYCFYIFVCITSMLQTLVTIQSLDRPYLQARTNASYASVQVNLLIVSILSMIPLGKKKFLIVLIISLFSVIVLFPIMSFVFEIKKKRISENRPMSTEKDCIQLLRITISEFPEEFVKWEIIKDISRAKPTTSVLLQCARMLSFFPSESHSLGHFLAILNHRSNLTIPERYAFFQIQKVYLLRQSSVSAQLNEDFGVIQKQTTQLISYVRNFWLNCQDQKPKFSLGLVCSLQKAVKKTEDMCIEAIDKYPNTARFMDEYSRFLIECRGDYMKGTIVHHKAELIEAGRCDAIDYSFRFFVNAFPAYLKNGIVDYKGRLLSRRRNKIGTHGSNPSGSSNSSEKGDLSDAEIDDEAAKIISAPKLRIAIQRAINSVPSTNIVAFRTLFYIKVIILSLIFIIFGLGFLNFFNDHLSMMKICSSLGRYRNDLALALYAAARSLASIESMTPNIQKEAIAIKMNSPEINEEFNDTNFGNSSLLFYTQATLDESSILSQGFSNISNSDLDFTKYSMPYLIEDNFRLCDNESHTYYSSPINMGMKSSNVLLLNKLSLLLDPSITSSWKTDKDICEILVNFDIYYNTIRNQSNLILSNAFQSQEKHTRGFGISLIIIPVAVFVMFITLFFYSYFQLLRSIENFRKMIEQLPRNGLEQSSAPLTNLDRSDIQASSSLTLDLNRFPLILLVFSFGLITIATILIIYYCLSSLRASTIKLTILDHHIIYSSIRASASIETLAAATFSAPVKGVSTIPITHYLFQRSMLHSKNEVSDANMELIMSKYSILGFSKTQDKLNFEETCSPNNDESSELTFHDSIQCMSTTRLVTAFFRIAEEEYSDVLYTSSTAANPLETDAYLYLKHIVEYHLYPMAYKSFDDLQGCSDSILQEMWNSYYINLAVVIIICILSMLLEKWSINSIAAAFNQSKRILCRLEPHFIFSQASLMNFITGRENKTSETITSAEQSVIDSSPDAIISLGPELSIETMNPTTTIIFGYTPEQLIGQNITTLLPSQEKTSDSFYRQISLMKTKQVGMTYNAQLIGVRDDGSGISLNTTLLGIDEGESFVLIMNDQTEAQKQQKEVEDAKAHAERLLYQILPRDIVNRLNSGEKDISFTVPSASVIFIDVVKFSEFTASLNPKQILLTLGTIFKNYDSLLVKYKSIIKIKVIGDTYMGAAGLFTPNQSPKIHASEMVSFALEAIGCLDDINRQFDSNLQVRIGINSGGPLIAGVLGTDKPLFDIIGDPINVAARLQSTSYSNHIQISQGTYDLIKDKGFTIEARGEVQLKGKGKQMAYFVNSDERVNHMVEELSSGRNSLGSTPLFIQDVLEKTSTLQLIRVDGSGLERRSSGSLL